MHLQTETHLLPRDAIQAFLFSFIFSIFLVISLTANFFICVGSFCDILIVM